MIATFPPRQSGFVVLALLSLLLLVGVGFALGQRDLAAQVANRARQRSAEAVAQARMALVGSAITHAETYPGDTYARLPCPDLGPAVPPGDCGIAGEAIFGRLAYDAVGLADLRDGWGECLWYAAAAAVKPHAPAPLNWDTPGQFDIVAADGTALTDPSDPHARAIAVVFAPAQPLPGQHRAPSGAARCSGSGGAADLAGYLDAGYPVAPAGLLEVRQGSADSETNNDLAGWITMQDIFDQLRRRSDFPAFINGIIDRAETALHARLAAEGFCAGFAGLPCDGAPQTGRLPDAAALGLAGQGAALHEHWRDQFWFVTCTNGSACLTATIDHGGGAQATQACTAVLLFGGERRAAEPGRQSRASAAERADPAQYAEGDNAAILAGAGGVFSGRADFAIDAPREPASTDVLRCLN